MSTPNKGNVGVTAYTAAVRRLRETHPDEFAVYLREERVARGLTPEAHKGPMTPEQKIAKLQAQIEKLRAELVG